MTIIADGTYATTASLAARMKDLLSRVFPDVAEEPEEETPPVVRDTAEPEPQD